MLADDPNDISRVDDWIEYGKRQSDDPRRQRFVAEFNMNMDHLFTELLDPNDEDLVGHPLLTDIRQCFEATWLRAARQELPTAVLHVHETQDRLVVSVTSEFMNCEDCYRPYVPEEGN